MNLSRDFHEAELRVQRLAAGVLFERLDLGHRHAAAAHPVDRVPDQRSRDAVLAVCRGHRQVRDAADPRVLVQVGCDVADDDAVRFGDEDAVRLHRAVELDRLSLASGPIAAADWAKLRLDVPVDRHTVETLDRDRAHAGKVFGAVGSDCEGGHVGTAWRGGSRAESYRIDCGTRRRVRSANSCPYPTHTPPRKAGSNAKKLTETVGPAWPKD